MPRVGGSLSGMRRSSKGLLACEGWWVLQGSNLWPLPCESSLRAILWFLVRASAYRQACMANVGQLDRSLLEDGAALVTDGRQEHDFVSPLFDLLAADPE